MIEGGADSVGTSSALAIDDKSSRLFDANSSYTRENVMATKVDGATSAVFDAQMQVDDAIKQLRAAGVGMQQPSIVGRDCHTKEPYQRACRLPSIE